MRLTQLRERKAELERELIGRDGEAIDFIGSDDDGFDHEAWLTCELEAVKMELRRIRQTETIDGGVDYE